MTFDAMTVIGYSWDAVGFVWLLGYAFTKRTVRVQPIGSRLFYTAVLVLGGVLLSGRWFRYGWLATRVVPDSVALQYAAAAIAVAGCAFAIWARLTLGANWSGRATVKEGHELITSGPYAFARHPIYTGLLTAVLGTALARGEWRCLVAIFIIAFALMVKMSQEERLMMQTFPDAYRVYRQRVKALIPGVL
jgi:protein-S-isoprenylcysteine O-methyltransferase Ste14